MTGVFCYPVPVLFAMHTYPQVRMPFMVRFYLRLTSGLQKRFMAVSRFAAGAIRECMGVPGERVEVVHNSFRPVTVTECEKLPVVLTVGHVDWYKNPECWLKVTQKVIARLPDVRFVWVGGGIMLEPVRKQVEQLGLDRSRVVLAGYSDDVAKYYASSLLYFQPSVMESHGIAVVEAMAHGLPCVTSNAGGLPESVRDGETGFICPPDDAEGFAARIMELLGNPALRERMGTAGRERAERLFSETMQEKRILALYAEMVMKKERASA
jgi:glycosyltransferase involved in cell wall biosynthesis